MKWILMLVLSLVAVRALAVEDGFGFPRAEIEIDPFPRVGQPFSIVLKTTDVSEIGARGAYAGNLVCFCGVTQQQYGKLTTFWNCTFLFNKSGVYHVSFDIYNRKGRHRIVHCVVHVLR